LQSEIALLDFVWDSNHNLVKKVAWWWDDACYYCLPHQTVEIFGDAPAAENGAFRLSYANLHFAEDFPAIFDKVVSSESAWLNSNIDVYLEWTGIPFEILM
jgi:hypothetical protein